MSNTNSIHNNGTVSDVTTNSAAKISACANFRKLNGLLKTYARVISRSLSTKQKELINTVLPKVDATNNLAACINNFEKVCLEIGFGGGENLIHQSKHNPNTLYIGAEPYLNGVVKVLSFINESHAQESGEIGANILLHTNDARQLFTLFEAQKVAFNEIFILFPDPWPKARHNKKRLINQKFLMAIKKFMDSHSKLYITTDHAGYANYITSELNLLVEEFLYEYSKEKPSYAGVGSKYEHKGLENGRCPHYFTIRACRS